MDKEEFLLLKKNGMAKMDACYEVLTQTKEVLMEDHNWSRNNKKDNLMLDLYSSVLELEVELKKYQKRYKSNKTKFSAIKNQILFAQAYQVSSEAIEAMIEISA